MVVVIIISATINNNNAWPSTLTHLSCMQGSSSDLYMTDDSILSSPKELLHYESMRASTVYLVTSGGLWTMLINNYITTACLPSHSMRHIIIHNYRRGCSSICPHHWSKSRRLLSTAWHIKHMFAIVMIILEPNHTLNYCHYWIIK